MHWVGVRLEVMDRREIYFFMIPELYEKDVEIIRNRLVELRDAPSLADIQGYSEIPKEEVNARIRFNRAYLLHLQTRLAWEADRAVVIGEAIKETEGLYQTWQAFADMNNPFYYVSVRRQGARRVRDAIGEEAWRNRELPPFVPYWRFNPR
jgi:hypothetical protein